MTFIKEGSIIQTTSNKLYFSTLLLFCFMFNQAQDTIYYDIKGEKTKYSSNAETYSIIRKSKQDTNIVTIQSFIRTGKIWFSCGYSDYSKFILSGKLFEWYSNGTPYKEFDYNNGKLDGDLKMYWPNGKIKRNDKYAMGKLIEGNLSDSMGKAIPYFEYEISASFRGGNDGLRDFIKRKTRYPLDSRNKRISGKVFIKFVIDIDGSVKNIEVLKGVNKEIDEEAIRVIKKMPKWKPAMVDGVKVKCFFNLPISFVVDK